MDFMSIDYKKTWINTIVVISVVCIVAVLDIKNTEDRRTARDVFLG